MNSVAVFQLSERLLAVQITLSYLAQLQTDQGLLSFDTK